MKSTHKIIFSNANEISKIETDNIGLVVTSPPYPMIEMWDQSFSEQNPEISSALKNMEGDVAFELMHKLLDKIWDEVYRVLIPGGFACINIGDATRTINKHFKLYCNHARILTHCLKIGFTNLPAIIWRKQTNAPNKFMGSGMLPAGAYVTLEHEHILVLRKGNKRVFKTSAEKLNRAKSALFWEERNIWFSDIWWDLKGVNQKLNHSNTRKRSGAYPLEVAYRLVNMFSVKGDTILDPFLGTGTTTLAAITSNRNSIGFEIDQSFEEILNSLTEKNLAEKCNHYIKKRIDNHLSFVKEREQIKGTDTFKHRSKNYKFPVITRQEVEIVFDYLLKLKHIDENKVEVEYLEKVVLDFADKESLYVLINS